MPDRPSYHERTWAPPWVLILLWGACLVDAGSLIYGIWPQESLGHPFGDEPAPTWVLGATAAVCLVVPTAVTLLFTRLDVEVWPREMRASFGPLPMIRRSVPYGQVEAVTAVTYRPIRDFGGWGIRFRPGKTAWTVRGNRAVRLDLESGRAFYVGSRFPHRLAERIRSARRADQGQPRS